MGTGSSPSLLLTEAIIPGVPVERLIGIIRTALYPVIVSTTCTETATIKGFLGAGAHDYLLKPVVPNLLRAKIEHALGPSLADRDAKLGLASDPHHQIVIRKGYGRIKLTRTEFLIFSLLFDSYPKGVSREGFDLIIWPMVKVTRKTLDVHVFKVRKKLEPFRLTILFDLESGYCLRKIPGELGMA